MKKKVGILTMHKVLNFGSALQAYALLKKVESMGFFAELINYSYPNAEHCKRMGIRFFPERSILRLFIFYLIGCFLLKFPWKFKEKKAQQAIRRFHQQWKFRKFYKNYFKLSSPYRTIQSLSIAPPQYDIYITGSDQVWNPKFMVGDSNFLLSFVAKNKIKCSYASSFSCREIPQCDEEIFKKHLGLYNALSVRESSSAQIVFHLIGKKPEVVCDPTLLLNREEWLAVCPAKKLVRCKYLLVYILHYAYDPYPGILDFVKGLSKKKHLRLVVLNGLKDGYSLDGALHFDDVGPIEFLQLFRDAEVIVTTSFHGTAFALNFKKKFYSVVENANGKDNRISDLLFKCGAEHHLIEGENINQWGAAEVSDKETELLEKFRTDSKLYLQKCLGKTNLDNG